MDSVLVDSDSSSLWDEASNHGGEQAKLLVATVVVDHERCGVLGCVHRNQFTGSSIP